MSRDFSPAYDAAAVTPADSDLTAGECIGFFVGGAGDVAVKTAGGTTVTFSNCLAGAVYPIKCVQIRSTNTTATNIVALYRV